MYNNMKVGLSIIDKQDQDEKYSSYSISASDAGHLYEIIIIRKTLHSFNYPLTCFIQTVKFILL